MNHPNFPFGRGLWVWYIKSCFGGNLDKIIAKCKEVGLTHLLIKSGDGTNTWHNQWTPDLIKYFHDHGIKVYSWTYVYGDVPLREAAIAMWSIDMGADGHVFDAETQYEGKPNSAITMMRAVRQHNPNTFLAYAPFPIIDYHLRYPYIEFGKYCDAVMPQMYWGDFKQRPQATINWTFQQFSKWEKIWKAGGHGDSVKPIIPAGQAYDNPTVGYKNTPADIAEFIQGCRGYKSVNFWSFQHILRADIWEAIKNNNVDLPSSSTEINNVSDSRMVDTTGENVDTSKRSTEEATMPVERKTETITPDREETKEPIIPPQPQKPTIIEKTMNTKPIEPLTDKYVVKKRQIDYFLEFFRNLFGSGKKV